MMTLTEKFKRTDSMRAHWWALSNAYLRHMRAAVELMKVSAKNPPESILRYVRKAEAIHWQLKDEAFRLWREMREAEKTLEARPHIWESEDGEIRLVMPGRLPDGKDSSRDEDEALKMYADYKVVEAVRDAEVLANMEVPF